ncbi:MAG: MmgE/PrpD family protein [Acidimicrobiales bacterium]
MPHDAVVDLAQNVAATGFDDLAPGDVTATKHLVLDTLATLLAGSGEPPFERLVAFLRTEGGRPESTILVHGGKVPARNAVIVNSAMARAIDLDDVHEESIVHTGVAVVPAALAVAERQGDISGREFMTAVALGQDLMIRLSAACAIPPNLQGRPGTYVFGTFATAAVTAKLLGFERDRVVDALGNAYLRATGSTLGYHDGALSQRVLQGTSASEGVLAALLADNGVGGITNCLEGRGGYYPLYEGGRYDRDVLLRDLGRVVRGTETSLKPFPVHRGLNLEIEAALVVATTRDYRVEDIEHVAVRYPAVYAEGHANIGAFDPARADPKGPVEPHFADAWGVAVALVRRRATLDDFTEAGVAAIRAEVVPVARRVVGIADDALAAIPGSVGPKIVEVTLTDGSVLSARVDHGKGSPANPFTWAESVAKFEDCSSRAAQPIGPAAQREVVDLVARLDEVADVARLASLLCP